MQRLVGIHSVQREGQCCSNFNAAGGGVGIVTSKLKYEADVLVGIGNYTAHELYYDADSCGCVVPYKAAHAINIQYYLELMLPYTF